MRGFITAFACIGLLYSVTASAEEDKDMKAQFIFAENTLNWLHNVSGVAGSVVETKASFTCNDNRGVDRQCSKIFALDIREAADDPLRVNMHVDRINPDILLGGVPRWYDVPGRGTATSKDMLVNIGGHRAATAVQVCVNNDKIKGIKLWGVDIKKDATLGTKTYEDVATRKNCKASNWADKVSCGNNKIIAKFRFHYKSTKSGFSGIAIQCGKIKRAFPPAAKPKKREAPVKGLPAPSTKQ